MNIQKENRKLKAELNAVVMSSLKNFYELSRFQTLEENKPKENINEKIQQNFDELFSSDNFIEK